MTVITLRVLCANCGGDELLCRLGEGTGVCPWCQLSFRDDFAPAGESRPIYLDVVLMDGEATGSRVEHTEEVAR